MTRQIIVDGAQRHRWLLDPAGQLHHQVARFETGSAPKQVAFTPDGDELWVTLLGGPGVAVHDPLTGKRLTTIDLADHGAVEVIFTSDGSTAYVSQMESASVFEVDTATHEVRRQLATEGVWTKVMLLSPDEERLYASNWVSNDVSEIDLDTGEVLRRLPTVTTPRGLYVTPDGDTLYVAGFDTSTGEPLDAIVAGNQPTGLDVSADGRLLAFSDFLDNRIQVFEIPSHAVLMGGGGGRFGLHRDDLAT